MPNSIKGQVSIMLNREIVESVKFFQQADAEFISEISCMLNPQIYMNNDYIVKIDEPADSMFFIHSGYIEILCKNFPVADTHSLEYVRKTKWGSAPGSTANGGKIMCLMYKKREESTEIPQISILMKK